MERKKLIVAVILLAFLFLGLNFLRERFIERTYYYPAAARYGGTPFLGEIKAESGYELEVKEGYVWIKSKDISKDRKLIEEEVTKLKGYVEASSLNESQDKLTLELDLRVPVENTSSFLDFLISNFEVRNWNLRIYRLNIRFEKRTIEIYNKTLARYEQLMQKAMQGKIDSGTIEAIAKIAEKQAYFERLMERELIELEEAEKDAKLSKVRVYLEQQKEVKLLPEDFGRKVKLKLRESISESLDTIVSIFLDLPVFLLKLLKYFVYALLLILAFKKLGEITKLW